LINMDNLQLFDNDFDINGIVTDIV
jgi:hypothetical protein